MRWEIRDWTLSTPRYGEIKYILKNQCNFTSKDCEELSFRDIVAIFKRQLNAKRQLMFTNLRQSIKHDSRQKEQFRQVREVAEAVDRLIMEPATMQKWREQVKTGLRKFKKDKDLKEALIDANPINETAQFYTIIALCHDDQLRVNPIITEELKAFSPKLCSYPQICAYMTTGFESMLKLYLGYVVRNLGLDKKTKETVADSLTREQNKQLPDRFEKAYHSYAYACNQNSKIKTDKQAYDYLKRHGFKGDEEYELPAFSTWSRYVRKSRLFYGTPKYSSKVSQLYHLHKVSEIESLTDITAKYENKAD